MTAQQAREIADITYPTHHIKKPNMTYKQIFEEFTAKNKLEITHSIIGDENAMSMFVYFKEPLRHSTNWAPFDLQGSLFKIFIEYTIKKYPFNQETLYMLAVRYMINEFINLFVERGYHKTINGYEQTVLPEFIKPEDLNPKSLICKWDEESNAPYRIVEVLQVKDSEIKVGYRTKGELTKVAIWEGYYKVISIPTGNQKNIRQSPTVTINDLGEFVSI